MGSNRGKKRHKHQSRSGLSTAPDSAVEIGLLITPWPIASAFVAPVAGRLVERYPAGLPVSFIEVSKPA
jgi:hypothetical protein